MSAIELAHKPFIKAARYDEQSKELVISFQTSTYVYSKVPPEVGLAFVRITHHKGMEYAFDEAIEGKYASRKEGA